MPVRRVPPCFICTGSSYVLLAVLTGGPEGGDAELSTAVGVTIDDEVPSVAIVVPSLLIIGLFDIGAFTAAFCPPILAVLGGALLVMRFRVGPVAAFPLRIAETACESIW